MARQRVLSFMSRWGGDDPRPNFLDHQTTRSGNERDKAARNVTSNSINITSPSSSTATTATAATATQFDREIHSPSPSRPRGRYRSASQQSSRPTSMIQTYQPPMVDVAQDTVPELQRIFSFLNSHSNKLYQEGYFLKLHDLDTRGRPSTDRAWTECFAQLVGTVLSLWDAASLDQAGEEGEEGQVMPTFINLSDASIRMIESLPMNGPDGGTLNNVLSISTAANNRYLLHFNSLNSLTQWTAGIRLSMFENASLQEGYTGSLVAGKGRNLTGIREIMHQCRFTQQDWARVRFGAGTPWRRCYYVISPPDEKEVKKMARKHRGAYGKAPVLKGDINFYDTSRVKKKTKPIATITDAFAAYAIYPQSIPLVESSTLVKIEGSITIHTSPPTHTEGFVFVMPEVHPAVSGFEMMLRFLFPVWDIFHLYGRPGKLVADPIDARGLMFALPTTKRYGYLEILDVAGLIHTKGSATWSERQWRREMKNLTSTRMMAVRTGDPAPGIQTSIPRNTFGGSRSSLPPSRNGGGGVKFGDDSPALTNSEPASQRASPAPRLSFDKPIRSDAALSGFPGHRRSASDQIVLNEARGQLRDEPHTHAMYGLRSPEGSQSPPKPPPHHVSLLTSPSDSDSLSAAEGRPSVSPSSDEGFDQKNPLLDVEHMRVSSPAPAPVAAPPTFQHGPSQLPRLRPNLSSDVRRELNAMDDATLAQLQDANRAANVGDAMDDALATWTTHKRDLPVPDDRSRESFGELPLRNGLPPLELQHQRQNSASPRYRQPPPGLRLPTIPASPHIDQMAQHSPNRPNYFEPSHPPVPEHGEVPSPIFTKGIPSRSHSPMLGANPPMSPTFPLGVPSRSHSPRMAMSPPLSPMLPAPPLRSSSLPSNDAMSRSTSPMPPPHGPVQRSMSPMPPHGPIQRSTSPIPPPHGPIQRSASPMDLPSAPSYQVPASGPTDRPETIRTSNSYGIHRKPVGGRFPSQSGGSLNSMTNDGMSTSSRLGSLTNAIVDTTALDIVGGYLSGPSSIEEQLRLQQQSIAGPEPSRSPDYASTKSASSNQSVDRPHPGKMRSVGTANATPRGDIAVGDTIYVVGDKPKRDGVTLDIDFGPTYALSTELLPGISAAPGTGDAQSVAGDHRHGVAGGSAASPNAISPSNDVKAESYFEKHRGSTEKESSVVENESATASTGRRIISWIPGLVAGPQNTKRESIFADDWVRMRAGMASAFTPGTPMDSVGRRRSKSSSGSWKAFASKIANTTAFQTRPASGLGAKTTGAAGATDGDWNEPLAGVRPHSCIMFRDSSAPGVSRPASTYFDHVASACGEDNPATTPSELQGTGHRSSPGSREKPGQTIPANATRHDSPHAPSGQELVQLAHAANQPTTMPDSTSKQTPGTNTTVAFVAAIAQRQESRRDVATGLAESAAPQQKQQARNAGMQLRSTSLLSMSTMEMQMPRGGAGQLSSALVPPQDLYQQPRKQMSAPVLNTNTGPEPAVACKRSGSYGPKVVQQRRAISLRDSDREQQTAPANPLPSGGRVSSAMIGPPETRQLRSSRRQLVSQHQYQYQYQYRQQHQMRSGNNIITTNLPRTSSPVSPDAIAAASAGLMRSSSRAGIVPLRFGYPAPETGPLPPPELVKDEKEGTIRRLGSRITTKGMGMLRSASWVSGRS